MSENKYQLMYDPTPSGWMYGFPKAVPDEGVAGEGINLYINPDFDFDKWVVEQGYPEELNQYGRFWVQEVDDICGGVYEDELKEESTNEKMGDLKFTTAKDYIYPGTDCQE